MIKMQERSFDYPKPNPGVWNMIQISCLDLSLATEATLSHVSEFGFGYWNNRMTGPWIWLGYSNKTNARCQKRGHLRIQDHIQGPEKESLAYPRALFKPLFFWDDTALISTPAVLQETALVIQRSAEETGLHLKWKKCQLYLLAETIRKCYGVPPSPHWQR